MHTHKPIKWMSQSITIEWKIEDNGDDNNNNNNRISSISDSWNSRKYIKQQPTCRGKDNKKIRLTYNIKYTSINLILAEKYLLFLDCFVGFSSVCYVCSCSLVVLLLTMVIEVVRGILLQAATAAAVTALTLALMLFHFFFFSPAIFSYRL